MRRFHRLRSAAAPSLEILLEVRDAIASRQQRKRTRLGTTQAEPPPRSPLASATADEQALITGIVLGELRQGALAGLMFESIAKAANVPLERVRRASMFAGDPAQVARHLFESGEDSGESALDVWNITLFRPVSPMLAQPAADVTAALGEMPDGAALEFKLDGARIQVHKKAAEVRVYTRALNEVTDSVPEIVESAQKLPADELILDGEVIALTPEGRPHPFQVTMRRFGRRTELDRLRSELPLTPVYFDLLYMNGEALIDHPQSERFARLRAIVPPEHIVEHTVAKDPAAAAEFLRLSLDAGHEGIMAKSSSSLYIAGGRGQAWLKIKKAHTLDLVVLAVEWGSGRREGWLSNIHLGARDTVNGGYAMLGKTFKGMTDEILRWQTEQFLAIETHREGHTVYVEPKLVVEIAWSDIQISPRYKSGLALRFARVKRYRTDKTAAEADTFETIKKLAGIA